LLSEFNTLLKKFLAIEEVSQNKSLLNASLMRAFTKKKCFNINLRYINKALKEENDSEYEIDYIYFKFISKQEYWHNLVFKDNLNFPEIIETIDAGQDKLLYFFLTYYLRNSQTRSFLGNTISNVPENELLVNFEKNFDISGFLNYYVSQKNPDAVILKIDYLFYSYLKNDITEKQYFDLKKIIIKNLKSFFPVTKSRSLAGLLDLLFQN
jgi:hypothetical protein